MISIKFPFDIKYYDPLEEEVLIINLTEQGGLVSEKQCTDIAFMLLAKEHLKSIVVYNPDKADSFQLMKLLNQRREIINPEIKIKEVLEYEV